MKQTKNNPLNIEATGTDKSFILRMKPELHKAIKTAALEKGETMQVYILSAILDRLQGG